MLDDVEVDDDGVSELDVDGDDDGVSELDVDDDEDGDKGESELSVPMFR